MEDVSQAVDGVEVGRIGEGDGENVVVFENRYDSIFLGDVPRNGGDDVLRHLLTRRAAQYDASGRAVRVLGVTFDVTEARRAAEEA